jgi:non-specific serine/threonine protein kinase
MQTMKNTVNPAMLKQLAAIPPAPPPRREREREEPVRPSRLAPLAEDVHMRTVKHEAVAEKPKGLEDWEKRLVEKADNKRKATVAQLCE